MSHDLPTGAFLNMMLQRMLGKASKVMDARMKFYVYSSVGYAVIFRLNIAVADFF